MNNKEASERLIEIYTRASEIFKQTNIIVNKINKNDYDVMQVEKLSEEIDDLVKQATAIEDSLAISDISIKGKI